MPRVPTVDPYQVAPAPLRGGEVRTVASGELMQSGVARQLGEAGRAGVELSNQLQVIQDREDTTAVLQAEADVKGRYLEWEAEAKQRRGTQAYGLHDDALKWWGEATSKAGEGLTPRQRAAFDKAVLPAMTQARGSMSSYEQGQRREALDQSVVASIGTTISWAAADPANVPQARAELMRNVAIRANNHGWDAEVTKAAQLEVTTKLHAQVVQTLAQKDPGKAAAYFEQYKAEIDGTQHAELGKFAEQATRTQVADAAADEVWRAHKKGDSAPLEQDKMEDAIRARFPGRPDIAKEAIQGLRERATAFQHARKERLDAVEATVHTAIMNGATLTQIRKMPEFLAMDGEKQRRTVDFIENRLFRAEQHAAARANRAAAESSRAYTEEGRRLQQLHRQGFAEYFRVSDPQTLAGMSRNEVTNLLPTLGAEHTQNLLQRHEQLQKPKVLAEAKIDDDTFKHLARQRKMPIDETNLSPEKKAQIGELKYRVERVIESAQQRAGKPLSGAEKEAVMRQEMARTVSLPGSWPWSDQQQVPVIGMTPEQAASVVVPKADRAELQAKMAELYKKTGSEAYRPGDDNLRRFYLRSISKTADLIPAGK